jgi:hypothetical protein
VSLFLIAAHGKILKLIKERETKSGACFEI